MIRMMHIQCDVTAPLYWWKDYDTYKVATVANGCSTMHKLHDKKFDLSDFTTDDMGEYAIVSLESIINDLNHFRELFLDSDKTDMNAWHSMNQLLPHSFNQKRTIDLNYETALQIILDRSNHKTREFREFARILHTQLPLMDVIVEAVKSKK